MAAGDPLPEVSRYPARAMTRGQGLQPDPEVGVLSERLNDETAGRGTKVGQAPKRLPAHPGVGVSERGLQQRSQLLTAGVHDGVERCPPHPPAGIAH
jgi:hypothetical protein